jgi:hypothetical protein
VFTSSEDGEEWSDVKPVTASDTQSALQTPHPPSVCAYKDHIYLAFTTHNKDIKGLSSGYDMDDWSPEKFLHVQDLLFLFFRVLMTESIHTRFGR